MVGRETVAWHEAGHAVVAAVVGNEIRVVSLTDCIVLERPPRPGTALDGFNGACISLAGPVAEMRKFAYGEAERDWLWDHGWSVDLANARQRHAGDLGRTFRRTDRLVARHWRAIERVADALLDGCGELSGAEVMFLVSR